MRSERLAFEPMGLDHAAELLAALDHPDVGTHIGGPDVTTLDALLERILHLRAGPPRNRPGERWVHLVVRLAGGGPVIGRLEATVRDGWAEIAYVFDPRRWGAGYATEAASWFAEYLAEQHGATELWAAVHPANERSLRLLERLRFAREDAPSRSLASYDDGDVVLRRDAGMPPGAAPRC